MSSRHSQSTIYGSNDSLSSSRIRVGTGFRGFTSRPQHAMRNNLQENRPSFNSGPITSQLEENCHSRNVQEEQANSRYVHNQQTHGHMSNQNLPVHQTVNQSQQQPFTNYNGNIHPLNYV